MKLFPPHPVQSVWQMINENTRFNFTLVNGRAKLERGRSPISECPIFTTGKMITRGRRGGGGKGEAVVIPSPRSDNIMRLSTQS